jgi:hypothetical protein
VPCERVIGDDEQGFSIFAATAAEGFGDFNRAKLWSKSDTNEWLDSN